MNTQQADLIKPIHSSQSGPHENLSKVVQRNQQNAYRKPAAEHTRQSFDALAALVAEYHGRIILDSGCGTAVSTRRIAQQYPDSLIIGIDRSEIRLGKQYDEQLPDNAITVRADLIDFWNLAVAAGWKLQRHFILYPNPYPKGIHLKRRWHGHPIFPTLLKLGGQLELRTNWLTYAEEFALALRQSEYPDAVAEIFKPDESAYWTLFEKKYHLAGQALYHCQIDLSETHP